MITKTFDELTYRNLVYRHRPYSVRMEDSWQYIRQATRNNGEFYLNNNNLVVLGKHPSLDLLVAVNVLGDISCLKDIRDPILAKNVHPLEREIYFKQGFRELNSNEYWSLSCKYDDQTYPQQILSTQNVIRGAGGEFEEMRREIHRVQKLNIKTRPYTLDNKLQVEELLIAQDKNNKGTYESHEMYLDVLSGSTIYEMNKEIVGFTLIDEFSNNCVAANAFIYNTEISGFPGYVTHYLCSNTRKSFFNMQGSETKSLDTWKRKFDPVMSIKNMHLIRD